MAKGYRIIIFVTATCLSAILLSALFFDYIDLYSLRILIEISYLIYSIVMLARIFVSSSILLTIVQVGSLFLLSPNRLNMLASYTDAFKFTDSFFVFYAYCGFTLTVWILESTMEWQISQRKKHNKIKYDDFCHNCNHGIHNHNVFCSNCNRLSHHVTNMLNLYPKKHHLDFALDVHHGLYRCPFCGKAYGRSSYGGPIGIQSPICFCFACNNFFIDNDFYEWSVISFSEKIKVCLWGNFFKLGLCLLILNFSIDCFRGEYRLFSFFLIIGAVFLRIVWIRFVAISDIQESEARLKDNPEYPQLLADMGYQHLDTKYHHLYRKNK